ncbi:DNA repair exonuclease SbcCD ATPase subunit [Geosmithia morbida]|uniref:DNA repair exonuclease SbcCD ATPase subunit n=1 Tax=Geosmithia morbida TaxID=1094350 RepID=A0A9P4Z110_9HYPO|nr:DNA repair exonuclease SbcCD ATPase subunit [Geosmithia morbida]KAF4125308.1 DNA repair exonuclease SbcCD ATPase subunit [Geosmithia morbida]
MPRVRAGPGFSGLIGSDSEPDFDNFHTAVSSSSLAPGKSMGITKSRGRPLANAHKVTKPAPKGVQQTNGTATARQALQDKTGSADTNGRSCRHADNSHMEPDLVKPTQPARARPKTTSIAPTKASYKPTTTQGPPPKAQHVPEEDAFETGREESMEVDEIGQVERKVEEEFEDKLEDDRVESVGPNRTGRKTSADDGSGDVSLRQQLEELGRRYESLESRYKELREVGVKEAERNYDRLKRQADENSAGKYYVRSFDSTHNTDTLFLTASSKLISELRAELAARSSLGRKLETTETRCDDLQVKVDQLSTSLSDARSEIKTLNTKLAAARNAEISAKVNGSTMKANGGFRGPPTEVVQTAQAKEDLYGDLTGLIVRGMKHEGKEDVFDCIQAGRNGTLHFKLALETADASGNYEDVQYTYRPQLDPGRDGELMDILPYYLLEEITFPRPHASKFYSRVTKSLSESLG